MFRTLRRSVERRKAEDTLDQASIPIDFVGILVRLLLAAVGGAILGANREQAGKPAGLRTHALVGIGACLFTIIGLLVAAEPTLDLAAPGRIVQGVIAGVGFIGAGAIFRREGARVGAGLGYGLTTAASIWIVAAVGTAAGAGLWRTALAGTGVGILILLLEDPLARLSQKISDKASDGQ